MAHFLIQWILVAVLCSALLVTSQNSVSIFYVKPSEYINVTCPAQPCLTLDEYAREQPQYFINNSSFVFLPGVHQLDYRLRIEEVSNMALLKSDGAAAQVAFSQLANISWVGSNNITINGLEFLLSGESDDKPLFSTLTFQSTSSSLSNVDIFSNGSLLSTAIRTHSSVVEINDIMVFGTKSLLGAGLIVYNSTITFSGQNYFVANAATLGLGGAMYIQQLSVVNFLGNVSFVNNSAMSSVSRAQGGAIYCESSSILSFSNTVLFHQNQASSQQNFAYGTGGGIVVNDNSLLAFETSSSVVFTRNHAFLGGAIAVLNAGLVIHGKVLFEGNSAGQTGGAIQGANGSRITCNGTEGGIVFRNNSAGISEQNIGYGGAISSVGSDLSLDKLLFERNTATVSGGAIDSSNDISSKVSNCDFYENTAPFGSAVYYSRTKSAVLDGINTFKSNVATVGGTVNVVTSNISFFGANYFLNNYAATGAAVTAVSSTLYFISGDNCSNTFESNVAKGRGGALSAINSTFIMSGSVMFIRNSATNGGAIHLSISSKLALTEPLKVSFIENSAYNYGGVFFYDDSFTPSQCRLLTSPIPGYISESDCFIELDTPSNIQLTFENNTAGAAGILLYGGNLDNCRLYVGGGITDSCGNRVGGNYSDMAITTIQEVSRMIGTDNLTSQISSDPLRICFCTDSNRDIQCLNQTVHVVRGKEFTLMAVIVGQNDGIVPSSVRTSLDNDIEIAAMQRIQPTGKTCSPITYRLSSSRNSTSLVLFPDGPCRDTGVSDTEITINFLPCPDGFTLVGSDCVCEKRLQRFTSSCSVDDNTIKRDSSTFWMGVVMDKNETYEGLILHPTCPFDFCVDTPVLITLDNLDVQCNNNHSGILCGSCVSGYSVAFTSLHCLPCSNVYLALILPFAFAGIALVAILLVLQMSVASGLINGLIFYANVIQVNRSIFFPSGDNNILTVFIAWLNLDLGIETCFFDGMDTYVFTWLQFVFPFYVWFLIGLIVVFSNYSSKVARFLGTNPVATLATLFLLSYSKILRTIIVALSFTRLEYPDDTFQVVWLYDGNIAFFQTPRHIVLGTFAIAVLLVLFLPYTLLLITGHWLQAYSHLKMLSWLNKLKPLTDAYHAPYRKETRYWTGFILFVRCALFFTFSFNILGNASVNLLAISSVTAGLAVFAWIRNRIYEKLYNDFLEAFFILNLCILAVGTYHVRESEGSQAALVNISVGVSCMMFILIVIYHLYLHIHKLAVWKLIIAKTRMCYIFGQNEQDTEDSENKSGEWNKLQNNGIHVQAPTTTSVQLREPLLES